jgi:hypothetical protein
VKECDSRKRFWQEKPDIQKSKRQKNSEIPNLCSEKFLNTVCAFLFWDLVFVIWILLFKKVQIVTYHHFVGTVIEGIQFRKT